MCDKSITLLADRLGKGDEEARAIGGGGRGRALGEMKDKQSSFVLKLA